MRRFPVIAIVPTVLLACTVWLVSASYAQEAPEKPAAPANPAPEAGQADTAATPAVTEDKLPNEFKEAFEEFRKRDPDTALGILKKAVKKYPDYPPPQVILAQWYAAANVGAGAQASLEQAVIDSPEDPEAYGYMGNIALQGRRNAEARLLFEKAQSLLPKLASVKRKKAIEPQVLNGLAETCRAWGDFAGTQKYLEAWLRIDEKNTMALEKLGVCLLEQNKEQEALEQLVKAVKIDEEKPAEVNGKPRQKLMSPEGTLAAFYAGKNKQKEAEKWMTAAVNARPKDLATRVLATRWALGNNNLADAKKNADLALRCEPEQSLDALILRGAIALFEKDYASAEKYFQAALLQSPKLFAASNNLALALVEQNSDEKKRRALEYAEDNARQHQKTQNGPEAFSTYGWVLYKLGNIDEADKALKASISSSPSVTPDTAYYMARVLSKRARDKEARRYLEEALKSTAPFANRSDAQKLLEELKK
jgi:tetratricopeptide (TPR) repeat protein